MAACSQQIRSPLAQGTTLPAKAQTRPSTPPCGEEDTTPSQTAGPFFTPNSPERASLIDGGMAGTPIALSGQVLTTNCVPIANALLDVWHADDQGEYDNQGYRLRGHQYTDSAGRYRLATILPGIYPGRTRHFHIKVQAANGPVLTTQLYFPGESLNDRDFLFQPELLMESNPGNNPGQFSFDFVLPEA